MSPTMEQWAIRVVKAALPMKPIEFGPWAGSMRSISADKVPRDYIAGGSNFLYLPRSQEFKRRNGQTQKFDTFGGGAVGMLPAKWGAKCRQMEEFISESITDGTPTLIALLTVETTNAPYSTVWIRNQVDNTNYTLGSEYDVNSYPPQGVGIHQIYKIVPLWYESGDGGLTRGESELGRRFLVSGSRRMLKVGNWWYFPSRPGTPSRWRGNFRPNTAGPASTATYSYNRLFPSGPIPPTHSGTVAPGATAGDGPWKGSDRFAYAVAYRSEDGSIWAPCPVRMPNATLPNGFGIATVDIAHPGTAYRSIIFSGLPSGPHGTTGRIICRGPKVDATGANALNISPYDLRPIWEIPDNTTKSYECFDGDDATLPAPEIAGQFIRHDYMMPPRLRYIWSGDMRICHAHGGLNPCAMVIAPTATVLNDDLEGPDDDSGEGYATANASFMRLEIGSGATPTLRLIQVNAVPAITDTLDIDLSVDNTLQKVADRINATEFDVTAVASQRWRAQICPNANPEANPATTLTPHSRILNLCAIVSGVARVTRASGGLSKVAIGTRIRVTGVGAMDAFVVTAIVSDTELTLSANATASVDPVIVTFYFELGDEPTAATAGQGYQRVIANSLPGFLYFTKTELDKTPIDKSAVWMTSAQPGGLKSAANCFSRKTANRHTPPTHAGVCLGGGGVDNGFVVFWVNKRGAIRNTRDSGTGLDEDYRLFITNESSGCSAWNTIISGDRCVFALSPEGLVACDLFNEVSLSQAIFTHAPALLGDFSYENPLDAAASAADTDAAYASTRVMRGALWISYRASGSHPNRQSCYDFSTGLISNGLAALTRDGQIPWGWSVPLARSVTAMCEGRRTDGVHLYGWNEENAGSTGDGRIDEIETSDTDNGTAIVGSVETPWERAGLTTQISGQECIIEHNAPAGSTGFLDFTRSYLADLYSLTPSTSSTLVVSRDVKMFPQAARVGSAACMLGYRQLTGGARTIRKITLKAKLLPSFK